MFKIASQGGLAGHVTVWLVIAFLALLVLLRAIAVLDAAVDLRNKWHERPR